MGAGESRQASPERRIVALILPELLCELAHASALPQVKPKKWQRKRASPLGVVLTQGLNNDEVSTDTMLDAVNDEARRFGVRKGQTIAEASALVAHLRVERVTQAAVSTALARIAEMGMAFGATVAFEAPETIWVDITGASHLKGGEVALAHEFAARVRALGHTARLAIASGPELARAFARWAAPEVAESAGIFVVQSAQGASSLANLPILALPLDVDTSAWLAKLGVLRVADLLALPRESLAGRLGELAPRVFELCSGQDNTPLVAHVPPHLIVEQRAWDEPLVGVEPLLFVLGDLVAKVSARLIGRGEAAESLVLRISQDAAIARFHGERPEHLLRFKFATPLYREGELRRVITARLSRAKLAAPSLGMVLEVSKRTRALARQLELSQVVAGSLALNSTAESELPVLLAELSADIGEEHVGVLELFDSHRPEAKSRFARVTSLEQAPSLRKAKERAVELPDAPTRLLPVPLELRAPLRVGSLLAIDRSLYTIERLRFEHRLDAVEWWGQSALSRDYIRLWLSGAAGGFEAQVFVDRSTGRRYLHAISD
jgi:protein ImuB